MVLLVPFPNVIRRTQLCAVMPLASCLSHLELQNPISALSTTTTKENIHPHTPHAIPPSRLQSPILHRDDVRVSTYRAFQSHRAGDAHHIVLQDITITPHLLHGTTATHLPHCRVPRVPRKHVGAIAEMLEMIYPIHKYEYWNIPPLPDSGY